MSDPLDGSAVAAVLCHHVGCCPVLAACSAVSLAIPELATLLTPPNW